MSPSPYHTQKNAVTDKHFEAFENTPYQTIVDLLRHLNDAEEGIISYFDETNHRWIREAHDAKVPTDPKVLIKIESNLSLMRCLARLRPIDYVLGEKWDKTHPPILELRKQFINLMKAMDDIVHHASHSADKKRKSIVDAETQFNTFLVKTLSEAGLTSGIYSKKEAKKLLQYYRILSSSLEPARTMVTITYDQANKVLNRETLYPITEKSTAQTNSIQQLKKPKTYQFCQRGKLLSVKKEAFQIADKYFADLLAKPDRVLGSQARKTHLTSLKNGYIVQNELFFDVGKDTDLTTCEPKTLWLARSAAPVYIGKGYSTDEVQKNTQENFSQIQAAAQKHMGLSNEPIIHVTTLTTHSINQSQDIINDHVRKATEIQNNLFTNVPLNIPGTFHPIHINKHLIFGANRHKPSSIIAPLQRATRVDYAVQCILAASEQPRTISHGHCASGQDRLGGTFELAEQRWISEQYAAQGILNQEKTIERIHILGGTSKEITSHLTPGSCGLKSVSKPNNVFGFRRSFSEHLEPNLYRASANTNQKNNVRNVAFLTQNGNKPLLLENIAEFKTLVGNTMPSANALIQEIEAIAHRPNLDAKTIDQLNLTVTLAHKAFVEKNDPLQLKENVRQLGAHQEHILGSAGIWGKIGKALLFFAASLVMAAGILLAIPSQGTSLLMSIFAATKLAGIATASGVTGVSLGVGGGLEYKDRSLSRKFSFFRKDLGSVKALSSDDGEKDRLLSPNPSTQ